MSLGARLHQRGAFGIVLAVDVGRVLQEELAHAQVVFPAGPVQEGGAVHWVHRRGDVGPALEQVNKQLHCEGLGGGGERGADGEYGAGGRE